MRLLEGGSAQRVHQDGDVGVEPLLHASRRQLGPARFLPRPRDPLHPRSERQGVQQPPVQPLVRGGCTHPVGLLVRLGEPREGGGAGGTSHALQAVGERHIEVRRAPGGLHPVDDPGDPETGRARGRHVEQHVAGVEVPVKEPPLIGRRRVFNCWVFGLSGLFDAASCRGCGSSGSTDPLVLLVICRLPRFGVLPDLSSPAADDRGFAGLSPVFPRFRGAGRPCLCVMVGR
jgi:hypothetical protein